MIRSTSLVFLLMMGLEIRAEELAPRAKQWVSPCEELCANLVRSIQERPDLMVMRLEDALVINEPCAGEIVTAAIEAVRAKPHMVEKIVETALKVAPRRSAMVMHAVRSYTPVSEQVAVTEEIRRAEVPSSLPLIEVRRAEVASAPGSLPIEEIRRAEVPAVGAGVSSTSSAPPEEIRRAEVILIAKPTGSGVKH